MALQSCYECNKEISTKAVMCPQCGAPQNPVSGLIDKAKSGLAKSGLIDKAKEGGGFLRKTFNHLTEYPERKLLEDLDSEWMKKDMIFYLRAKEEKNILRESNPNLTEIELDDLYIFNKDNEILLSLQKELKENPNSDRKFSLLFEMEKKEKLRESNPNLTEIEINVLYQKERLKESNPNLAEIEINVLYRKRYRSSYTDYI